VPSGTLRCPWILAFEQGLFLVSSDDLPRRHDAGGAKSWDGVVMKSPLLNHLCSRLLDVGGAEAEPDWPHGHSGVSRLPGANLG
jgi:hypothetical protein